jgi:hypothetical protein
MIHASDGSVRSDHGPYVRYGQEISALSYSGSRARPSPTSGAAKTAAWGRIPALAAYFRWLALLAVLMFRATMLPE